MINIINLAKEDEIDLFLRCNMDIIKIGYILRHCKTFTLEDVKDTEIIGVVKIAPNDMGMLEIEKNEPLFVRQTFIELFVIAGISFFERYCRDWFAWGLKYSPTRLNNYGNKTINFLEILNSNDIKQTLINKIIDDINFQDIEECNKKFKEVYGFKIFDNINDTHKFKKYLNHRHIIAHNCGYIDIIYSKKMGISDKFVGNFVNIKDEKLEDLFNLLLENMVGVHNKITAIIYNELEKNIKKDKKLSKTEYSEIIAYPIKS